MESRCNKCRRHFIAKDREDLIVLEQSHHQDSVEHLDIGSYHRCEGFWELDEGYDGPIVVKRRFYTDGRLSVEEGIPRRFRFRLNIKD